MRKHVSALMSAIEETKMKQHIDLRTSEVNHSVHEKLNHLISLLNTQNSLARNLLQQGHGAPIALGAEGSANDELPPLRDQKEASRRRASRRQRSGGGGGRR